MALLVNNPPAHNHWVHEIKFDGYRIQTHILDSNIKMFTRGGLDWSKKFPTISKAFKNLKVRSAIFDGEVVVIDKFGRSHFAQLQDAISRKEFIGMRIHLFDLLYLNGEDLRDYPLNKRKALLKTILSKAVDPIFYSEDIESDGTAFFKLCCQHKLEGIVSKDANASYRSGKSHTWLKCKCSERQEFIIGGYTESKNINRNEFAALLLGVHDTNQDDKSIRFVGKVGTGFDSNMLIELKKKLSKLEQKKSPFGTNSPKGSNIHWIKPKLVAEIKFSNWTTDRRLRTPVFLGLRSDKASKEVVRERIELTHPQKIFFQTDKITKIIIANYYEKVANLMLPYISDRPLSLVRCPESGARKCFYQKHPGTNAVLKKLKSFAVKHKLETRTYFSLNSAIELRELVQMNVYEIHAWNSHYQTLARPDQIVIDFDPDPTVSFKEVVKACLQMKKMLDRLKLKSFVKVTGGKGLHIHIPVEPLYSWDQIKSFSKALADEMVLKNPQKLIATMAKKDRTGKIFIDYLRNGYGATAIAPYSLRAKNKSAVALPVSWSELSKLKSSDQFTLKKALLKIKKRKSDPWKGMQKLKQRISILEKNKGTL